MQVIRPALVRLDCTEQFARADLPQANGPIRPKSHERFVVRQEYRLQHKALMASGVS
jgi:hypothetical protein